jgi:hypothetical protein
MDGGGFDAQSALMAVMGLTTEQQTWLASNPTLFDDVVAFLDDKCWDEGAVEFTNSAFNLMMYDSDVKWVRLTELFDILQQDPNALWCDQSGGELNLNDYQDLLNFVPPQECQARLDNLNQNTWHNVSFQPIEGGNTPLTNIDYFSVEISQVPDFDLNGIPDSPDEILESIRSNFPLLAIGTDQPLYPTCPVPPGISLPVHLSWSFEYWLPEDEILWNSSQPLTSMFIIEGDSDQPFVSMISDDGAVMTTQHMAGCCWIFTSLNTPLLNGLQPFSGNRQFGIFLNSSGNYEFYTKAIDRANTNIVLNALGQIVENCDANDYYEIANVTWTSLCDKVASFINNYGGSAQVTNTLQKFVDYSEVLAKLKSASPINLVPCN